MRIPFLLFAGCLTAMAQPSLTIYNQRFAVVRDVIPLDLKQGMNTVQFTGATVHLEPDSVMLRDPAGRTALKVMEQNFRAEPISEGLLLNLFEGKELDFEITNPTTGEKRTVRGRIVRSGYVPHSRGVQQYDQTTCACRRPTHKAAPSQSSRWRAGCSSHFRDGPCSPR